VKKFISVLILVPTLIAISGCQSQDNGEIADRARLEGKAQAEEQLKKDKELLEEQNKKERELQDEQLKKERAATDKRSKEMEKSLSTKQAFYEDNSGHYEGTMTRDGTKFGIRVSLFPNIPKPTDSRVRTPAEIEADLTTLAYNVQIGQWSLENPNAAEGCRVEGLRPDIKKGTLNIISSECPNSYYLVLNRTSLAGTAQPSNSRDAYQIYAERQSKKPLPNRK